MALITLANDHRWNDQCYPKPQNPYVTPNCSPMIDLCLSNLHLILTFSLFSDIFFIIISSQWCRTWIRGEQRRSLHQNHSSRCHVKTIHVIRRLPPMKHVARATCGWCETEAWISSRLQAFIVYCDAGYFIGGLFPLLLHTQYTHAIWAANKQGIESIHYQYAWYVWIVNNGKTEWTDSCLRFSIIWLLVQQQKFNRKKRLFCRIPSQRASE